MILEVDNKEAVDLCDNWSVSGCTRHIEVKQYYLQELKEGGILKVQWKSRDEMTSDIFMKILGGPLFEKYGSRFYGKDKYHMESLLRKNKKFGNKKTEIYFMAFETHREYQLFWQQMIDE